jgi:hypothetical protein
MSHALAAPSRPAAATGAEPPTAKCFTPSQTITSTAQWVRTRTMSLSPAESQQLMGLIETMAGLQYLRMEEVPQIPTRKASFHVAIYAPLDAAPMPPDVVLVRGNARQLMLLSEAAQVAGVAGASPAMGRPTCAVLPESINSARTAASFGCIGNRVYTGVTDEDAYFAIPGGHLQAVEEKLAVIVRANEELEKFHRARAERITFA